MSTWHHACNQDPACNRDLQPGPATGTLHATEVLHATGSLQASRILHTNSTLHANSTLQLAEHRGWKPFRTTRPAARSVMPHIWKEKEQHGLHSLAPSMSPVLCHGGVRLGLAHPVGRLQQESIGVSQGSTATAVRIYWCSGAMEAAVCPWQTAAPRSASCITHRAANGAPAPGSSLL